MPELLQYLMGLNVQRMHLRKTLPKIRDMYSLKKALRCMEMLSQKSLSAMQLLVKVKKWTVSQPWIWCQGVSAEELQ